jgi:hypothetical protein
MGELSDKGYGRVSIKVNGKRKRISAHKWVWEQLVGPVEDGYEFHHFKCVRKHCVNPEHVKPITPDEHKKLHGWMKLTPALVLQLRSDRSSGMTFPAIAIKYGIRADHAQDIVYRNYWKYVA